jgi:hypothetical protein
MTLDGRAAAMVTSSEKARLVSRDGEALWVVTAEGANASRLLDEIVTWWKWISPD